MWNQIASVRERARLMRKNFQISVERCSETQFERKIKVLSALATMVLVNTVLYKSLSSPLSLFTNLILI